MHFILAPDKTQLKHISFCYICESQNIQTFESTLQKAHIGNNLKLGTVKFTLNQKSLHSFIIYRLKVNTNTFFIFRIKISSTGIDDFPFEACEE